MASWISSRTCGRSGGATATCEQRDALARPPCDRLPEVIEFWSASLAPTVVLFGSLCRGGCTSAPISIWP